MREEGLVGNDEGDGNEDGATRAFGVKGLSNSFS